MEERHGARPPTAICSVGCASTDTTTIDQFWSAAGAFTLASASVHVMLLCCEMQDLDKAEVTAMKVKELQGSTPSIRELLDDHLGTIRSAIEHDMRIKVDRTKGWPCKVMLDAEAPVAPVSV